MVQPVARADCPAKINLYLKVPGKRPDGFHELVTIFQTIDLQDELNWYPGLKPIRLEHLGDVDFGESNLVRRAIKRYVETTGVAPTGTIKLTKRIPIGGGLGGGSSNAATMLELLNEKYQKLSRDELQSIGLILGSDVPFFLEKGCQWGFGRGEILEPCHWDLPVKTGFLFIPPYGAATAEVFKTLSRKPLPEDFELLTKPGENVLGENDLEIATCRLVVPLKTLMDQIRTMLPGQKVFMSGSGSTLVWLTAESYLPEKLRLLLDEKKVRVAPFTFI